MLGCRWYTPLLTRSVNTQLALCGALKWSFLMLLVGGWLRRQRAACGQSWLTALRLPGDLWSKSADGAAAWTPSGVLLCTKAHLMRRAVQWSPMKPES
jgi:hypothetical protein